MAQTGLCDNLEAWDPEGNEREVREGGDMGVPMADSCRCMTENHKILYSNYPPIKKKKSRSLLPVFAKAVAPALNIFFLTTELRLTVTSSENLP